MSEETKARPLLRLFPVLLCNLIAFGATTLILAALVKEEFGGGGTEVGTLFTLQALGQLLTAAVWGSLSDRWGRKPVLILTIAGAIAADLWTWQTTGLMELYVVRFVAGLCAGTIATASAYVADVTDTKTRSQGMAVIGICFGLGFTFGPGMVVGASKLAELYGWSRGFPLLVGVGLNVLSIGLALWLLREGEREIEERSENRERKSITVIRELLKRPGIRTMGVLFLAYSISVTILEATFYVYMSDQYGFKERQVGTFFLGMGLLAVMVQGNIRRISGRIGDRKMSLTGLALLALGMVLCTGYEALWFLIPWLGVVSVGRALLQPGAMALMSGEALSDGETGKVMSVMQSAQSAGRITAPLMGGLLYDHVGARTPFVFAGIVLAGAGLWWSKRHKAA